MDDRTFFDLDGAELTPGQLEFLRALRRRVQGRLSPYCAHLEGDEMLISLDVDVPGQALTTIGLELRGSQLRGDEYEVQDRVLPRVPSQNGFVIRGTPEELAERGAQFLLWFDRRPVVRHDWLHEGRVYALCYLFEDTHDAICQMYRRDWAPPGQPERLIYAGHVFGQDWIQTSGLDEPDLTVLVRGCRAQGSDQFSGPQESE